MHLNSAYFFTSGLSKIVEKLQYNVPHNSAGLGDKECLEYYVDQFRPGLNTTHGPSGWLVICAWSSRSLILIT